MFNRIHILLAKWTALVVFSVAAVGCQETDDSSVPTDTPAVVSVSPAYGSTAGYASITLTGTGFLSGARVTLGSSSCRPTAISQTQITCVTSSSSVTGAVNVTVINPNDNSSSLAGGFTYQPTVTLTSVSPSVGSSNGGNTITLTGAYFPASFTIAVGGASCTSVTVVSATQATCITPTGTGTASVTLTGSDGQVATLSNAFTFVNAPTLTTVAPTYGPIAGDTVLTLTGTGFTSGATVNVGASACTNVNVVSSTQINCLSPSGSLGTVDVTVTRTDTQSVTKTAAYTYTSNDTFNDMELLAGAMAPAGAVDGIGSAARFNAPYAVVEAGGYLYVGDCSNNAIRRIDLGNGDTTTFAGVMGSSGTTDGIGAAARFACPQGFWFDGVDTIYVTDNHSIRKLTISTATVATWAGGIGVAGTANGTGTAARFNAPAGLASDGTTLYVADRANHSIRTVNLATAAVTTWLGTIGVAGSANGTGTAASFNGPYGIALDATNAYITDYSNHAVRRAVLATGVVTTFTGVIGAGGATDGVGAAVRHNGPLGIIHRTTESALYITDHAVHRLRKIDIATATVTSITPYNIAGYVDATGSSSRFTNPRSIGFDTNFLYIPDQGNNTVRKFNFSTTAVTTIAGVPENYGYDEGPPAQARFNLPYGTEYYQGKLYVADRGNCIVRQIDLASRITSTVLGLAASCTEIDGIGNDARLSSPERMARNGASLFISSAVHTVRKFDISTGDLTLLAGSVSTAGSTDGTGSGALFSAPRGVASDGTNLYVAETGNHIIRKIVIATGVTTLFAGGVGATGTTNATGSAARFNNPYDVVYNGGYLYVADYSNHKIRRIDVSTAAVTDLAGGGGFADGTGLGARFNGPIGIATDGATYLYVADYNNHAIRKVNRTTGQVTTILGSPSFPYDSGTTSLPFAMIRLPMTIRWTGSGLFISNTYGIYRVY